MPTDDSVMRLRLRHCLIWIFACTCSQLANLASAFGEIHLDYDNIDFDPYDIVGNEIVAPLQLLAGPLCLPLLQWTALRGIAPRLRWGKWFVAVCMLFCMRWMLVVASAVFLKFVPLADGFALASAFAHPGGFAFPDNASLLSTWAAFLCSPLIYNISYAYIAAQLLNGDSLIPWRKLFWAAFAGNTVRMFVQCLQAASGSCDFLWPDELYHLQQTDLIPTLLSRAASGAIEGIATCLTLCGLTNEHFLPDARRRLIRILGCMAGLCFLPLFCLRLFGKIAAC